MTSAVMRKESNRGPQMPKHIAPGFAQRLETARANSGLTQSELAAQAGVARQSISNWENGKYPNLGPQLRAVAQVLGVSLAWLLRGEGDPDVSDAASATGATD